MYGVLQEREVGGRGRLEGVEWGGGGGRGSTKKKLKKGTLAQPPLSHSAAQYHR